MGALAEGIRQLLPGQELPFEERWEKADKLSGREQVDFIWTEIESLIRRKEGIRRWLDYIRFIDLPFTPQEVRESSLLSGEIKDFLSTLPLAPEDELKMQLYRSPEPFFISLSAVGLRIQTQRGFLFALRVTEKSDFYVILPQELEKFGQKVGKFEVARQLVGFAQELIHPKQQLGTTSK